MKPVDRVLTTLNHEEPDMVPCLWAVADGLRRLQETFRAREMLQDLVGVGSIPETRVSEQGSEHRLLESVFGTCIASLSKWIMVTGSWLSQLSL